MATDSALSSSSAPAAASISTPSVVELHGSKFDPHLVSIKLAEDNFLPWRQQALATIRGHKLHKFLLGSSVVPPKFSSPADATADNISEAFLAWEQQDQLLLSWLLASMSEGMLTQMVGCDYSYQVWAKLEAFFASQTKANVIQLKTQLRNLRKGSLSVSDFLLKIKKIIDSLFSIGCSFTEADHIEAILEGLPEEYTSFIVSVTSRSDSYSVIEIESLLLAHEERLEKFKKDVTPALSANIAQTSSQKNQSPKPVSNPSSGQYRQFSNSQGQGPRSQNFRGSTRGGNSRGRGRFGNASNRPQCQVCGKAGHMAWQCFHRFNHQFVSPFAQGSTSQPRPSQPMQAMMASQYHQPYENSWYVDTGATNHITADVNHLGAPSEYHGSEHIHLANGSGINISHVGSAMVHLKNSVSTPLTLNSLLHVPSSSKNLLIFSVFLSLLGITMFILGFFLILVLSNVRLPGRLYSRALLKMVSTALII